MTEATTPAEPDDDKDDKSGKRLTSAQWTDIVTRWELGTIKMAQIIEEFGISKQAVQKYFKRNNVVGGSRKGEIKTAIVAGAAKSVVASTTPTFADKRKQRIEDTREAHYNAAHLISQLTNKLLMETARPAAPGAPPAKTLAQIKEDLRALRYASAIQDQALKMRLDVLNAHDEIDETEMPEFKVEVLTADDIEEIRNKQDEDDMGDDALLETFEGDEDEDEDDD